MKQKLIDDILYVYSFEPYVITEDTDAKIIYVQEELFTAYKVLNPTLSQLAKKNFNIMSAYTPEWNLYRYIPDVSPSIMLNRSVLLFENSSMTGNLIEVEDSVGSFNLFEANEDVETQYSSSYTSVATINNTGDVTIEGIGTTVISAFSPGDETHEEYNEDYTLVVKEGNNQRFDTNIMFSESNVSVYCDEPGNYPTLINPYSVPVTYTTTEAEYVSVNPTTGVVTLLINPSVKQEVNIYATFAGNEFYLPKQVRYTLNVYPRRSTATLVWNKSSFIATIGETNVFPEIINPDNLTLNYYSSDDTKATVNLLNGNVTLLEATTEPIEISAVFTGNEEYKPITAIYSLTIIEEQKQETLDVEYYSGNGIIQLYGEFIEPPIPTQNTLDVDYYASNGLVQLYGEYIQPSPQQETLDIEYHSENGAALLYGYIPSQVEIE